MKECPFKLQDRCKLLINSIYKNQYAVNEFFAIEYGECVGESKCPVFLASLHIPSLSRKEFKKYFGGKK